MKEEKILKLLENEFGKYFIVYEDYDKLYIHCYPNDYVIVLFEITKEHEVEITVLENYQMIVINQLPKIKLKTEEQIIQLIKAEYRCIRDKYNNTR